MKKTFTILLLGVLLAFSLCADGGGGMLFGYQTSSYPFLDQYPVANNSMGLIYFGGYGYGVSYSYRGGNEPRSVAGGFGYAIMDASGGSGIAGGFGGFITGVRFLSHPINVSLLSWTGFGGLYTGTYEADGHSGFFSLVEEVTLEVGLPIVRWFMPTVYAGYQVAGNLIPGVPFKAFLLYTPVIGFRIQWGRFY